MGESLNRVFCVNIWSTNIYQSINAGYGKSKIKSAKIKEKNLKFSKEFFKKGKK
jgi:hypothetical protein